jgi:hypothetical protein
MGNALLFSFSFFEAGQRYGRGRGEGEGVFDILPTWSTNK